MLAGPWVAILLGGYLLLNGAYSLKLKHLAILDVLCVSLGFVLRCLVGAYAAGLDTSRWIILMTFLLGHVPGPGQAARRPGSLQERPEDAPQPGRLQLQIRG